MLHMNEERYHRRYRRRVRRVSCAMFQHDASWYTTFWFALIAVIVMLVHAIVSLLIDEGIG
jgi:hypothetical protein